MSKSLNNKNMGKSNNLYNKIFEKSKNKNLYFDSNNLNIIQYIKFKSYDKKYLKIKNKINFKDLIIKNKKLKFYKPSIIKISESKIVNSLINIKLSNLNELINNFNIFNYLYSGYRKDY